MSQYAGSNVGALGGREGMLPARAGTIIGVSQLKDEPHERLMILTNHPSAHVVVREQ